MVSTEPVIPTNPLAALRLAEHSVQEAVGVITTTTPPASDLREYAEAVTATLHGLAELVGALASTAQHHLFAPTDDPTSDVEVHLAAATPHLIGLVTACNKAAALAAAYSAAVDTIMGAPGPA